MSDGGAREPTPLVELVVGGIGALLLLFMLGYLARETFETEANEPVDLVLEEGTFSEQTDGWRVPVRVRNAGDEPAEAAELRAELTLADGEVEEAALTIDFLAPHGEVEAAFLFEKDPNGGELRLRAVGYLEP